MVEVAMADRGFELRRNFEGETGICGDVLTSSPFTFSSPVWCRCVEASNATSSSSSSGGCTFLVFLLEGGWSEPLDSRGTLPFHFLEAAEAGGRVRQTRS